MHLTALVILAMFYIARRNHQNLRYQQNPLGSGDKVGKFIYSILSVAILLWVVASFAGLL